jgi:cystathionine gamma-lyase
MSNIPKSLGFSTRSIHPGPVRTMATPPHTAPTALEARMANLEGGAQGFAVTSGRAAIACLLDLVNSGAHVIVSEGLHGGRYRLLEDVRRRASGLRISYVDPTDRAAFDAALIPEETKMVWVECPASPRAGLADLAMIAGFAAEHDLISVCDNTHATPYLRRPIEHGFKISLNAAPGYLYGGVLDEGAVVVIAEDQDFLVDKFGFLRAALGAVPLARDSDLALAALASLAPRMDRICDTAGRVALFLAEHPKVEAVLYPGLASHPRRDLAERQMSGPGGAMSFVVEGGLKETRRIVEALGLIKNDEGPGGPGTVIDHPSDALYSSVPEEIRARLGLADGLFQLWIGLEDADDLIEDLRRALG